MTLRPCFARDRSRGIEGLWACGSVVVLRCGIVALQFNDPVKDPRIYIYIYICVYAYIYIYRERGRDIVLRIYIYIHYCIIHVLVYAYMYIMIL